MKKFLKIIFFLLILILLSAIGVTTYQYNTFTPVEVMQDADPKNLVYFQNSYEECRKNFISSADKLNKKFANVAISKLYIESKKDPDLTIDYCYVQIGRAHV